jgi:hypothetical protein
MSHRYITTIYMLEEEDEEKKGGREMMIPCVNEITKSRACYIHSMLEAEQK